MDPDLYDPTTLDPDQLDVNGLPLGGGSTASSFDPAPFTGYDPTESTFPVVFSDPGSNSGGSITPSQGASGAGGSGFGTFLGQLAGSFTKVFMGAGTPQQAAYGKTATGSPCVVGTAGCAAIAPGASSNTTLLVLVGVGALVLIIALRK